MGTIATVLILTNIGTFLITYLSVRNSLIEMGVFPVYRGFIKGHIRSVAIEADVRGSYHAQFQRDVTRFCSNLKRKSDTDET